MEPITTSAIVGGVVSYLGSTLSKNKSLESFLNRLSDSAVGWFRSIFYKENGVEKEVVKAFKENLSSEGRADQVKACIKTALEDNPDAIKYLEEVVELMKKTKEGTKIISKIYKSKNVLIGQNISATRDINVGDNKSD